MKSEIWEVLLELRTPFGDALWPSTLSFFMGRLHDPLWKSLSWVLNRYWNMSSWLKYIWIIRGTLSSVQLSLSHVWLFANLWTAAHQVSLSVSNSQSLLKRMSIELVMPSNHLILCHPLLLLPSVFYQGLFKWVSSSYQVARVLEFQLHHQSFQWT